eukprot:12137478-Alexandrium_andersonii.AAC.1
MTVNGRATASPRSPASLRDGDLASSGSVGVRLPGLGRAPNAAGEPRGRSQFDPGHGRLRTPVASGPPKVRSLGGRIRPGPGPGS